MWNQEHQRQRPRTQPSGPRIDGCTMALLIKHQTSQLAHKSQPAATINPPATHAASNSIKHSPQSNARQGDPQTQFSGWSRAFKSVDKTTGNGQSGGETQLKIQHFDKHTLRVNVCQQVHEVTDRNTPQSPTKPPPMGSQLLSWLYYFSVYVLKDDDLCAVDKTIVEWNA